MNSVGMATAIAVPVHRPGGFDDIALIEAKLAGSDVERTRLLKISMANRVDSCPPKKIVSGYYPLIGRAMPSSNMSAEQRRSHTVETVIALAGQQNPSEITTAVIAAQMGVTQGALFRHFPSKDAIWQRAMEWVADRLLDRIDHAAGSANTPPEALRAIFMSHLAFVIENPGVPRLMFGELQHARETAAKLAARSLLQRYADRVATQLEAGKLSNEIATDIETRAAAILFIGTIQGLVMQSMISGDPALAQSNAEQVFKIYLRALRPGLGATATKKQQRSKTPNGGQQI